ncbi:MAG: Lar family restriction alleviation protein [Patescibacteria group bacterium]|nr:Lar family restriction alleviation protein [Patescibacteria group bacterium]
MTLLKCPFCGSSSLQIGNTHTPSYWVECEDCGAAVYGKGYPYSKKEHSGFHSHLLYGTTLPKPYVLARMAAIKAWNRRV